jgi:hypothetical protein
VFCHTAATKCAPEPTLLRTILSLARFITQPFTQPLTQPGIKKVIHHKCEPSLLNPDSHVHEATLLRTRVSLAKFNSLSHSPAARCTTCLVAAGGSIIMTNNDNQACAAPCHPSILALATLCTRIPHLCHQPFKPPGLWGVVHAWLMPMGGVVTLR